MSVHPHPAGMTDQRFGQALRALRRRRGWRQVDLAAAAGVPQSTISDVERGHLDGVPLRTLRALVAALDGRADLDLFWRSGALDRLLDRDHASLVEGVVRELVAAGWQARPEVTYSRYGERGSIDVVGVRPELSAALIAEVKSDVTSVEATNRQFDPKIRLAAAIVQEVFGFTPNVVGATLVLPDSTTARRRIALHAATFDARYPARTVELRRWMARPVGPMRAIWFLPNIGVGDPRNLPSSPTRVTRARPRSGGRSVPAANRV